VIVRLSDGEEGVLVHEESEALCVAFRPDGDMLAADMTEGGVPFFGK
jgi:hypothetical protein